MTKGERMSGSRIHDDGTIAAQLKRAGVNRRDFISFCGKLMVIAPAGLAITSQVSPAVVAIGSCSSWGGVPSSGPNPTGATGVDTLVKNKPVVNIPGCPPNPYIVLGTVLEYARTGKLPALDDKHRPKFAYDRYIHEHC